MTTKRVDVNVGTIDGRALRAPPAYDGTLTLAQRAAVLRGVADYTIEIARTDPDERDAPVNRARVLAQFRLWLSDLTYLTLCFGMVPADLEETVEAVGAALDVAPEEVVRLTAELEQCVEHYLAIVAEEPLPFWWMG
jgi:hypothetical protein